MAQAHPDSGNHTPVDALPLPVHAAATTQPRRSGTLKLFLLPPGESPGTASEAVPAYARFRLCRGFLDDLNRDLPIRLRIQLETEIAKGRDRGRMEAAGSGTGFRWEFTPG